MKSIRKLISYILILSTIVCISVSAINVQADGIDVSNYDYVVDNMTFYSGKTQLNSPQNATSVAVDVTKRTPGSDINRLVISTYTTNGEFINLYTLEDKMDFKETINTSVSLNIPKGKTLGEIKSFVWDDFYNCTPLSNVFSSNDTIKHIDPNFPITPETPDVNINIPNYAIIEMFKETLVEEFKVTLFTTDGIAKSYIFDERVASVVKADGTVMNKDYKDAEAETPVAWGDAESLTDALEALVFDNAGLHKKQPIQNRVVQYSINNAGKIKELKFMPVEDMTDNADTDEIMEKAEYSQRDNAIGRINLGESTMIINATKYASNKELSATTYAGLKDGVPYEAYGYGEIDKVHTFVLITSGGFPYTAATRFAVIAEDGYIKDEEDDAGDINYIVKVLCGDVEELIVSEDADSSANETVLANLKRGEVIFYTTDDYGKVISIDKLLAGEIPETAAELAAGSLVDYDSEDYDNVTAFAITDTFYADKFKVAPGFTTDWEDNDRDSIKVVYGPVMERTDKDISFGKIESGMTNMDDLVRFYYSDDIRVYTYDYTENSKYALSYQENSVNAISATKLADKFIVDGVVDWDAYRAGEKAEDEAITFAYAIVVDDEVQDIFAFLAE